MNETTSPGFKKGFLDAFPVFISYFIVSLAIGISSAEAGLTPFQAALNSFLNITSAGEAAGLEIIRNRGSYLEIILSQITINIRYLLMAAALTIKISPDQDGIIKRILMSMGITDENFGLAISQAQRIDPLYLFGCYMMSMPGWVLGTFVGATAGNIFPPRITAALSIALYAMFCSIIITPTKKDHILLVLVIVSMILSWIFAKFIPSIPFGIRVLILSVLLAAVAAWLFPIKEDKNE